MVMVRHLEFNYVFGIIYCIIPLSLSQREDNTQVIKFI